MNGWGRMRPVAVCGIMACWFVVLTTTWGYGEQTTFESGGDGVCLTKEHHTFSLYIENDVFLANGKDGQYTNGLKLSWSRYGLSELPEDAWLHKWLYPAARKLGMDTPAESEKVLTFSIGQNIYTPDNIKEKQLIKDDRPYAGITYAELGFHKKQQHRMHTFEIMAGIVGPHSYADEIQTEAHRFLGNDMPKGWRNQLADELVLGLVYDYKRKAVAANVNQGLGGDIIYHVGGSLGNALTAVQAGISFRGGWNIPNDCGNFPIREATCFNAETIQTTCSHGDRPGCHFFLSLGVKAVLRDIFLDGNTFRDSHRVDKKLVVGSVMTGIGITGNRLKIIIGFVGKTKSFDHQDDSASYGSIDIAFQY